MKNQGSKVFGIGLPRSGTTSLNSALAILGFNAIHHPTYLIMEKLQGSLNFQGDWDALTNFGEHFYPQLDQMYPNSKFILTIRDKERWLNSCRWKYREPSNHLGNAIRISVFGCDRFEENTFSYLYDVHRRNVLEYFKDRPDDLLEFNCDNGDGWEKLCEFLGRARPEVPFPHKNSKSEILTSDKPINYKSKNNLHLKNLRHYLHGTVLNSAFNGNRIAKQIVKYKRDRM